ncbi:endoribonuclease l-psp protein [Colletotrichum truncatum]|uniref:Endoribonuclease l-psp protein n=1 Tax=Colletotrichum truncatum TaxID=5467 RepID=A0ACC3Z2L6_COLTU|nr:endoribonuclease l-psp protein [Colletotrichum truncatum]KAF6782681.1 endoribonuclease l-psp protein [Colletotrichum truncatum]
MSSLQYNNPPGAAEKHSELGHYSQSVDLGNGIVKCSGQGGWDPQSGALDATDSDKQIRLAMENVDLVLKAAGLRGWEDVYLLRSYHCDVRTSWEPAAEALKKRIPGHRPVWTAVAVPQLAFPGMLIELEVEAKRQNE